MEIKKGDKVEKDQALLILEAMKMENELKAPKAGTIKVLHVELGQDVVLGAVLAEIE